MPLALAIHGAAGRMGRRLIALAAEQADLRVTAALDSTESGRLGKDAGELAGIGRIGVALTDRCEQPFDVLIDFSTPAGAMRAIDLCLAAGKPLVCGTTGLTGEQRSRLDSAAASIAVLHAANMSVGVNVLLGVVRQLAAALDETYDIEIVEAHHRFKADAPSGTALALRDSIIAGRTNGGSAVRTSADSEGSPAAQTAAGGDAGSAPRTDFGRSPATCPAASPSVIYGREGQTGARPPGQIGIHAVRMGDVVGRHEVHFGALGETITIAHTASNRDTFVHGALRAARWIAGRPAGRCSMRDVLFDQC